ncbi:hypothetical protein NP493_16g06012 [Ridgeia piscesae]|uniref:Uncharacterized protein n=1 Tax=Ridgeia piscesae TaxID=27915 RepID=A0AAD9PEA8_RIDPI|nr:hypothetical protein NP493_16g06011 [Ridgeia piscesae]KAK2193262.1 hypothetical protein NP493_16g06012 [Ridgeia piscesae]
MVEAKHVIPREPIRIVEAKHVIPREPIRIDESRTDVSWIIMPVAVLPYRRRVHASRLVSLQVTENRSFVYRKPVVATSLLGKFMVMDKDRYSFVRWLAEQTGASSQQALECFKCLDAWSSAFK